MNNSSDCNVYLVDPLEPLHCDTPYWVFIVQALYLSFIVLGNVLGNGLIVFLVARYKELRYRSVMVSLTAVIADLLLACVYQVPGVINTLVQGWIFGYSGCQAMGFIGLYLIYVRWMSMAIISMDRFGFIVFPLKYSLWSRPYLVVLTVTAWLLPAALHTPSIFGIGSYTYRPGFCQCVIDCKDDQTCLSLYVVIFSSQMVIGVITPVILYSILFCISYAKRRKIVMGTQGNEQDNMRFQPISLSQKDMQILVSYLLMFVTLVVTNLPIFVLNILRRSVSEAYTDLPLWGHLLLSDLFYLSSILTPLFIMRNRDFKRALKRFVGRGGRLRRRSISASTSTIRRMSQVRHPSCDMNIDKPDQQITNGFNNLESRKHQPEQAGQQVVNNSIA